MELVGDLLGAGHVVQLVGVDVAENLLGFVPHGLVGAVLQDVTAEGHRLGQGRVHGGTGALTAVRLLQKPRVEGQHLGGLQLEGVVRGHLGHGGAEQLQSLSHAIPIQKGIYLLQIFPHPGSLLGTAVAEQLVHGHAEVVSDGGEVIHIGVADPRLPAGHGLGGDSQMVGQLILGHVVLFAKQADLFADLDLGFHGETSLSWWFSSSIIPYIRHNINKK